MKHLGRLPWKRNLAIPALGKYLRAVALPPPPPQTFWEDATITWPMDGNDTYGDCVFAGWAHAKQAWSHYATGTDNIMTVDQVLQMYSAFTGFDPADPSTDQGAVMSDVVQRLVAQGDGFGNQPSAAATLNILNRTELEDAIDIFGGGYVGINAPESILSTDTWDVIPNDPIVGGHCVWYCGFDPDFDYLVSWGKVYKATKSFTATYVEEAYAFLDTAFLADGSTPTGISLADWQADMAALKQAA